ncbi:MAG: LssY C-terminal domain-containing protein [Gemmatimonadota bacterium]
MACASLPATAQSPSPPRAESAAPVFPAGTLVPIRFLNGLVAGRDSVGSPVLVQTLVALVVDGCIAAPAFTELSGRVTRSRSGKWFGKRGRFALRFDSLRVTGTGWIPVDAVLDSLEFARSGVIGSEGELRGKSHTLARRGLGVMPLAAAGAAPVAVVPAAMFAGWSLVRRGARPVILNGEAGVARFRAPLSLARPLECQPASSSSALTAMPTLPSFIPHTDSRGGRSGDPVNLILLGSSDALDTAFARAEWLIPQSHSAGHTLNEVAAALLDRSSVRAPVSTQYFEGRAQDLAYERPSATVRIRHHARLWLLDSTTVVWVGAANQDIGLKVAPSHLTHRISPQIDLERNLIVRELESTGCADLVDFDSLPGAAAAGRNAANQRYITDGRAAVIQVHGCPAR